MMEFGGKDWISMTWERGYVHYISSEPVQPYLVREAFQGKISCNILDCAYNSVAKTGQVFLMSEPDEDDDEDDDGSWYHEYLCKGDAPVMTMSCNGSLSMVRLRFSGK